MTTDLEPRLGDHLRRRADEAIPRYDLDAVEQGLRVVTLAEVGARRGRRPLRGAVAGIAAAVTLFVVAALIGTGSDEQSAPITASADVRAADMAVIQEMIDAINTRDTDAFLGTFAPDASFNPRGGIEGSSLPFHQRLSVADVEPVRAWMTVMDAWGLEAEPVTCDRPELRANGGNDDEAIVHCAVATRWHKISMEITEAWYFTLHRGEIVFWTSMADGNDMAAVDLDPAERELALGFDGLVAWEAWLREHHPDDAARLLNPRPEPGLCNADCREWREDIAPGDPERARQLTRLMFENVHEGWSIDGHEFTPAGLIPYDPTFADEIEASIREYLDENREET